MDKCRYVKFVKNHVIKIKKIGKIFMEYKKINFLSLKFILNLNFFIKTNINKKNGMSMPICFIKKIIGYFKWSIKLDPSIPALFRPYEIVTNSLLLSHIMWGTKSTIKTSKVIKYWKSNFFVFFIKIK